jgi:competence protein ComEC
VEEPLPGSRRPLVLRDRHVVGLALATASGAWRGGGPPLAVGAALLLVGLLVVRRPVVLAVALACLAATLADRAIAGLDPVAAGPVDGWARLVGDPAPVEGGGVRVDVELDGRRLEASAFGAAAGALADGLAGELVLVTGRLRPPPVDAPWLLPRRVVGRLSIDEVRADAEGSLASRAANGLRRTFADGAAHLSLTGRSLLGGVVLGDDREQPPELVDDFRAAGLSHIVVVSGQNVAYALVAFGPLLRSLRWRSRFPATLLVLGAFALVVRFEPSVLRAVAMAGVATVAAATGRPATGGRVLALAVTALVLVDPLLVRSIGFLLSVSASAAILGLAPRIRVAIGGPAWMAEPLSITLAAQVGTAPLLLATFGPLPVASIPANLLAVPVAGALMVWGLVVGFVAGLLPGALATTLHRPSQAMTWWLAAVADRAASLPLGSIDAVRAAVLVAVVVLGRAARRLAPDRSLPAGPRPLVALACGLVLLSAAVARPSPGPSPASIADVGVLTVVDGDRVLVIDGSSGAERALEALRGAGARCVDVVAVERASPGAVSLAAALRRRCEGGVVAAEAGVARPGWLPVPPGTDLVAAALAARDGR